MTFSYVNETRKVNGSLLKKGPGTVSLQGDNLLKNNYS